MATPSARNRRSPVARFNTFEQPDDEIKAQIGHAYHTQRALRHRQFLFHPKPFHVSDNFQPTKLQRNSRSFDGTTRPDSLSLTLDTDPHALDRTYSFNSLSTLQRESEAARQSQWRDSPVSAYIPADRMASFAIEQKIELEHPCPTIGVYTLKQARKDKKDEKRSIRKKEKEQKKMDKITAHRRRASEVQLTPPSSYEESSTQVPKRAASDPSSFRVSKEAAIQLVKRLTSTKARLIRRRSKKEAPIIPHVDQFLSKPALQEYLNPSLPESTTGIAELPGPLPPYTPFQNALSNENNDPVSNLEPVSPVYRSYSNPHTSDSPDASRTMRCDLCQFGIKLDEQYFHCSICNHGDRIVCSACDASGLSCRHELTERVRRVLRYDNGVRQRSLTRHLPRRRQPTTPAVAPLPDDGSRSMPVPTVLPQAELHSAPIHASATQALREKQYQLELKELAIQKREQDITLKERENALKERETYLRIREAESDAQMKQQEINTRILVAQMAEMASLGAQFARSLSQKSNSSDEDILATADTEGMGIRQHATKRKSSATGRSTATPKSSAQHGRKLQTKLPPDDLEGNGDDDDETGEGSPKKPRLDLDVDSGEVLYACHFCKFNGQRYSERNNSEKHYRGCSSGYWPDISRLKQHLYRVHWRGKHCQRCYKTFKSDREAEHHARELTACTMRECPFPEKFSDEAYNEIKRKRPTTAPGEVWYLIYGILFPGHEPPTSPFAESTDSETAPNSASTPPRLTQQDMDAVYQLFEARLDQRQDAEWLQDPGRRQLLREEHQASMADFMQAMGLLRVHTPPTRVTPSQGSLASPNPAHRSSRPPLHVQSSFAPSYDESPDPVSATSTRSSSSGHWLLPSHRRSFSRPFPLRTESMREPTLISATDTTPSEGAFRVPTPIDVENDQYDGESHSWQKGDESFGLAITTPGDFDFDLDDQQNLEPGPDEAPPSRLQGMKIENRSPRLMSAPAFKPVKIASLANHPSAEAAVETFLKPNISSASADSGYDSMSSRPSASRPHNQIRSRLKRHTTPPSTGMTVQDHVLDSELDLSVFNVNYQEFLGADMDECGNVNGVNLTQHLFSAGQE